MFAPPIDAEVDVALATALRLPPLTEPDLPAMRSQIASRLKSLALSTAVVRRDISVPGPDGQPNLILRLHIPVDRTPPLPCVYSMHGGGYVLGHRAMDDLRFDEWCPELGFIGVSVEYRLAPDSPFPAALDDCYAGLRWIRNHASELGIDPARIGVAGSSAGAGLAAAVAMLNRDRGDIPLRWQMLGYPMLDDRMATASSHWDVPVWSPQDNEFAWRCYLGPLYGSADVPPLAAPGRATNFAGLPPALIYVGAVDLFCDEDMEFAARLNRAGVPTELHLYPGAPHGFDRSAAATTVGRRCLRDTKEWLKLALSSY